MRSAYILELEINLKFGFLLGIVWFAFGELSRKYTEHRAKISGHSISSAANALVVLVFKVLLGSLQYPSILKYCDF